MIRQNGGGSGGGGGVQHLTALGEQDNFTLSVPGFQGSIDNVAVIVVSQFFNLAAEPPVDYVTYEVIDLVNKHTEVSTVYSNLKYSLDPSCNVSGGILTIKNDYGVAWQSVTYDVTIYMK